MNNSLPGKRFGIWLVLILYCALMIYLSHQPGDPEYVAPCGHIDKVVHVIEYAVFAALLLLALSTVCKTRILHIMIPVTLLFAVSDEIHQSFIPFREASAGDLLADFVGAGAAVVTYIFVRSRISRDKDQAIPD